MPGPRMGARWVDGRQEVFAGPDGFVGEAHGANSDASIVVGQTCRFTGSLDQSAWIWTAREGVQCVPSRGRGSRSHRIHVFDQRGWRRDRRGAQLRPRIRRGALDRSFAVVRKDYLRTHGVPTAFDGWINTGFITGVSPDGRILAGYGAGPRDFQGYIVILGSRP